MSAVGKSSQRYSQFDPRTLGDCALWLDAADRNSLTLSGSNVTQWNDKSGNARHATANVSATYDSSEKGLVFVGSNYYTTSYTAAPTSESGFIVFKDTDATFSSNVVLLGPTTSTTGGRMYVCYDLNDGNGNVFKLDKYAVTSYGSRTVALNTRVIAGASFSPTASSANTYLNGSLSTAFTASFTSDGTTQIGAGPNVGSPWKGVIYECIFYNSLLSTSQRQQVEGYLAWKWGISSSFQPTSISGLSLWLDAADSTTLALSGSNVTQWRDKSGSNNHTNSVTGTPQYLYDSNVRRNRVYFNGSSYMYGPSSNTTTTLTSFLVGTINSATNDTGRILSFSSPGVADFSVSTSVMPFLRFGLSQAITSYRNPSNAGVISITYDTPFVVSVVYNGTGAVFYLNGSSNGSIASSTGSFNYTRYGIARDAGGIQVESLVGNIYETLSYTAALSTDQRQQVEDYLSRKWNVSLSRTILNLPSSHPFRLAPPVLRPFVPTDIANCALWLDAADARTITLSGSNVTAWADKSGLGYSAAAVNWSGTITRTTQNGISALNFGLNTMRISNYSWTTYSSLFMVAKAAGGSWFFVQSRNNNEYTSFFYAGNWNLYQAFNGTSKIGIEDSGYPQGTIVIPANQYVLMTFAYGGASTAAFYTINGTSRSTRLASGSAIGTSSAQVYQLDINGRWDGASDNSVVCELIQYNGVLSDSQRQQVESYLATKWGLQGSTPSTHPARIAPALTVQFQPTLLSNCALWLDAADQKTLTLSGSNVTAWSDKSGNGMNATQATTSLCPTYSATGLNSQRPGLVFTTSYNTDPGTMATPSNFNFMRFPNVQTGTNDASYFAVYQVSDTNSRAVMANYKSQYGSRYEMRAAAAIVSVASTSQLQIIDMSATTVPTMNAFVITSGTTNTLLAGMNGTYASNVLTGVTPPASTTDNDPLGYIGCYFENTNYYGNTFKGTISELLIFTRALSTSERQQVEGYLATKWGLQGSLPASHPYKNTPLL